VALLADEPFVSWPAGEGIGFHAQVLGLCTAAGFTPHVVQEAQGMHAVLSLVAVEAGVAIVPASMASFRPQEIVYRALESDAARFTLPFCTRPEQPSPVLRNFRRWRPGPDVACAFAGGKARPWNQALLIPLRTVGQGSPAGLCRHPVVVFRSRRLCPPCLMSIVPVPHGDPPCGCSTISGPAVDPSSPVTDAPQVPPAGPG
jgi:hypothetical protein